MRAEVLKLTDEQSHDLRRAVGAARSIDDLAAAVDALYARVYAEVATRKPVCDISGRCCRFEAYGHRLFVTTVELAAFARGAVGPTPPADVGPTWDGTGCPYQVGGLCSAHAIRPFGCRIYFCDATSTAWQQDAYERFHAELRALHDQFGVPYFYVEWREGLRACELPLRRTDASPAVENVQMTFVPLTTSRD